MARPGPDRDRPRRDAAGHDAGTRAWGRAPQAGSRHDPAELARALEGTVAPDGDRELLDDAGRAATLLTVAVTTVTGLALHAVVGVLVAAAATAVPGLLAVALVALWAASALTGWRLRRRSPLTSLVVPFVPATVLLLTLARVG